MCSRTSEDVLRGPPLKARRSSAGPGSGPGPLRRVAKHRNAGWVNLLAGKSRGLKPTHAVRVGAQDRVGANAAGFSCSCRAADPAADGALAREEPTGEAPALAARPAVV